jgi:hypothetical protein
MPYYLWLETTVTFGVKSKLNIDADVICCLYSPVCTFTLKTPDIIGLPHLQSLKYFQTLPD